MADKETELTAKFLEPSAQSAFRDITQDELLEIVHMDARKETNGVVESSKLIIEKHGGSEGLAKRLKTNLQTGIRWSEKEKTDREQAFGKNSFPPPKIKTLWELVLENFKDDINRVLLAAAVVSIIIGLIQHKGKPEGMLEGVSISIALCIIIAVSSGNNYASEKRLADLLALADKQDVTVYRRDEKDEMKSLTVSYEELVVGDLIAVNGGMKVPADCIIVSGQDIRCKEDALTGEPDELEKTPLTQENYTESATAVMFAKAVVSGGVGKALVLAVGTNTASGVIMLKVQEKGEEEDEGTLLQRKLNKIADQIGSVGKGCAIATFAAIVVRIIFELVGVLPCGCQNLATCEKAEPNCDKLSFADPGNRLYTELLKTIIIAITVIVVAIPEGLPLAVTISLSFSSAKMQKEKNLVRKLASAETMGAVTHVCSDKTGTLTQNVMTTMACMCHQKSYRMASEDKPNVAQLAEDVQRGIGGAWEIMMEGAIWNSAARIERPKKEDKDEGFTGTEKAEFEYQGNVTDIGILKFFAGIYGIEGVRERKLALKDADKLQLLPFESRRKRGSIVVKRPDGGVRVYTKGAPDVLFGKDINEVKRLTDDILASSPTMAAADAEARATKQAGLGMVRHAAVAGGKADWYGKATAEGIESLAEITAAGGNQSSDHEDVFKACVKDYALQAYRTILICYRDMSMQEFLDLKAQHNDFATPEDRDCLEEDLIAVGVFGIQDPLRETIVKSVQDVKRAGIKVIMCTGDNIDTATAISKNAGIVTKEDIASHPKWSRMEGKDFRATVGTIKRVRDPECTETDPEDQKFIDVVPNQGTFNRLIKHLRVLARSSPEDKYLLVTGLQACPYDEDEDAGAELEAQAAGASGPTNYCSVAVTGDGTNDAPALAKADVGFAMGITGTDVAKGACDIILLDDNFASIITALRYGRNIYDNVRKFLQFQLTVNVVAMFIVFFGSVVLNDSPLTAVQMLWVNLIMDTLAALALATEPPDDNILERKPQPSSKSIVTEIMWRNVYGHALYQIIVLVVILFVAQGTLVETYDIKCLAPKEADGTCPEGALNPFYAPNHYYREPDTKKYWATTNKDKNKEANFDPTAWARFQCSNLMDDFPAAKIAEHAGGKPCEEAWLEITTALNTQQNAANTLEELTHTETVTIDPPPTDPAAPTTEEKQVGDGVFVYTPQKATRGTEKLLHMTYVFQIFVFMQVFNQINARILTATFNVFAGIQRNWLFLAVTAFTFGIQMVMVEIGGSAVKTAPLEMWQNGICLAFGAGELFWGVLVKVLPLKMFQCFNFEEKPMTPEELEASTLGRMKGGSKFSKSKSKKAQNILSAVGGALQRQVEAAEKGQADH